MERLVRGLHEFQKNCFDSNRRLFERLVQKGQNPEALFITCSDSRVNPNLLTQTGPGDLFIIRNAGNIVPEYGVLNGGEAATIEYACTLLGVKDIIVCGHSHCGAVQALIDPSRTAELPALRAWLELSKTTRTIIKDNYADREDGCLLTAAVEENVLVQLENLRSHPSVATRLAQGNLHLHGWVYKIETGQVFAYDPDFGQFLPLVPGEESAAAAAAGSAEVEFASSEPTTIA